MSDAIAEVARQFYWYHCVDLGGGVVTDGDYAMGDYWSFYGFPKRLDGFDVLDVGRASGFFSFAFEELGANVTATELSTYLDWDFVGGDHARQERARGIADQAAFDEKHITGAFNFAHRVRRSKVKKVTTSIYEIDEAKLGGKFDLIFAGSVTSHLRDPIRGMERFRAVTKDDGVCIVSAPYIGLDESLPLCAMVGTKDIDRRSWWVVNKHCLTEMLVCAGFQSVQIVGRFDLALRRKDSQATVFPHIVAHARP